MFAIVELLRAVAAFMVAPVFAHFAVTVGGSPEAGTSIVLWIGLGIAIGGAVAAVVLYVLGGARPQTPDLERFMDGEGPAWYSPPLLAAVRHGSRHPALAEEPAAIMSTEPGKLPAGRSYSPTTARTWRSSRSPRPARLAASPVTASTESASVLRIRTSPSLSRNRPPEAGP